jgi:Cdc6-like AAA superfamily ATPase
MRITLKIDWDISSQFPLKKEIEKIGHFVGRKKELSVLVNELLRRDQGSILVSGYRGVGKTSFVYKALQEVLHRSTRVIIVLINTNSLEITKGKQTILANLIRRLYTASLDADITSPLRGDIAALYKKAVSSTFQQIEEIEQNYQSIQKAEKKLAIEIDKTGLTYLMWFLFLTLAMLLQLNPIPGLSEYANRLIPLFLAGPIPLIGTFALQYKKLTSATKMSKNSAQSLYTIDNNLSNLEFDLEKIHRALSEDGIKTIYVLDELDKLHVSRISEILSYFKNLFTLSYATFIFVGGDDLLEFGRDRENDRERPLEYTYFTSRYLLSRPSSDELLDYIDEVTEIAYGEDITAWDTVKRAFILDSNCDYFDLIQHLKGNITGCDDLSPIIEIQVDDLITKKSKMQQIITLLYQQKYHASNPLRWAENEVVLKSMYALGKEVALSPPGNTINIDKSNGVLVKNCQADLTRYLTKLNVVTKEAEDFFTTKGYLPNEIPQHLDFYSELDDQLILFIDEYLQTITNYWNIDAVIRASAKISSQMIWEDPTLYLHNLNRWSGGITKITSEICNIRKNVLYTANTYKREELEKFTEIVTQATEKLNSKAHHIMAELIREAWPDLGYSSSSLPSLLEKRSPDQNNGFNKIVRNLITCKITTSCLSNGNSVFLVCNGPVPFLDEESWLASFNDLSKNQGLLIINPISATKKVEKIIINSKIIQFFPQYDYASVEIYKIVRYIYNVANLSSDELTSEIFKYE